MCPVVQVSDDSASGEVVAKRFQLSKDGSSLDAEIDGERLRADLSLHDHADEQVGLPQPLLRSTEHHGIKEWSIFQGC